MTEHLCIVCPTRRRAPVHYERAQVCEPDRIWLAETVAGLPELAAQLADYLTPGNGTGQKVGGSREAPLPFVADVHDLTAASRPASIGVKHRVERLRGGTIDWSAERVSPNGTVLRGDPDQVGYLSAATELEFWVTDWVAMRGMGEHLPLPIVYQLARWLVDRMEWAADNHPAIDEFAGAINRLSGAMRAYVPRMVDDDNPPPRRKAEPRTAPCRGCDLVSLWWWPSDERVRCDHCDVVMTESEYAAWARLVIAGEKRGAGV